MAVKFYLLQVSNIQKETEDSISISFHIPNDTKKEFSYKHGQYITIKVPIEGNDNRRAYSISSSPIIDKDLTITVKKVDDGIVSLYLNENLKIGDFLELMPPLGNFTIELEPTNSKNYIMIGAGSGITPLMSILKTILYVEPNSKIYLLYQNRNENNIIFKNTLIELENKYFSRFFVTHYLSKPLSNWLGNTGRIDNNIIEKYILDNINDIEKSEYFLCGPLGLMESCDIALNNLKINSNNIHKEIFTQDLKSLENEKSDSSENTDNQEIITQKIKIILYGEESEFEVEPDETVLTAAQRAGEDPPFSCQIGACSTCRAKLISGKVYMDECYSLTEEDIADSYILTCQAHPLTGDVIIDYDD